MPYLAGFVTPQDFGALGNGTNDDSSAINAALAFQWNTNGGGYVLLPPGKYAVANPVIIPPFTFLVGQTDITLNLGTVPSNVARITALSSWAPSSSTGIVEILSKTPGGWSVNTAACGLKNIYIDGSANASSNLQGINMVGPVYDVHLEDVFVYGAPHNGLTASGQTESGITPTFPYHQRYTRLSIVSSVNTGFNLANITDATLSNCLGFGNAGNNFSLQNNSNSVLIACRAEWSSGGRGFDITGSSGSIVFSGCTTDQNASEGLRIHSATGQSTQGGGIVWTGGKLHADGNGGTNNNGIIVTSSTVPVTITGVNVESGQNPNSSNYYPANAITLTSSSNVVVADSVLQGISSAWNDTGGNSFLVRKACLGMTGNPNTQTTSSLIDLPSSNVPLPSDQNLIAWTYDPALQTASSTPTSGVLYLCRINIRQTTTITNLLLCVAAAPSGLTASENSAGLYNSSGTLLSNVGDQTTNWGTTGLKTMGLGAAQTVAPGIYYLGFLANASTTTPGFGRSTVQSAGTVNAGTTASTPRWSTFGTGQTVLPSSVTISSSTVANTAYWAAFS